MQKKLQADSPIALVATSLVNLGIRSLKASLKKIEINSELYFLNIESVKYTSSDVRQIINVLEEQAPKIIGISAIELSAIRTKQLIKAIKDTDSLKDTILVIGGIHPTICPEEYIDIADIVLIGEGERIFPELAIKVLNGEKYCNIENLWLRKKDKLIKNKLKPTIEDINKLPFPDYSCGVKLLRNGKLVNLNNGIFDVNYPPPSRKAIFSFAARGCTRRCSFCINSIHDRTYHRSIRKRYINEEVEYLKEIKSNNPQLEFVYLIEDDFFLRTNEEIHKFSEIYKEKVNLPFFLYCTPETVTDEKLKLLINAGLKILNMGIQTGSERINRLIYNRNVNNNRILETTKIIAKYAYKIEVVYDFIINNPYETKEDLLATIELIKKIPKPFRLSIHFLAFYKGTALYNKALEDGIIDRDYCKSQFNLHNASKHLEKNEKFYLNSVIFWLHGIHNYHRYGLIPSVLLKTLISEEFTRFFKKFPILVSLINKFSGDILHRYEKT